MNFVITHSDTKRRIKGSFTIVGSKDDFRSLAKQINTQVEREGFIYGEISILANNLPDPIINSAPIGWDE